MPLRRSVFENEEYAAWANASTIHVMSYYVAPEDDEAEPTKEVERDGEKLSVLVAYPDFTKIEMELLMRGIDSRLQFPEKTPWAGVIAPDGRTVLAEKRGSATAKEFRALYDAEAKKLGASISREEWRKVTRLLTESTTAEVDERWSDAVKAAALAHAGAASYPKALQERVTGQVDALRSIRARRVEAASKLAEGPRAKELARIDADFAALPPLVPAATPKDGAK